MLVEPVVVQLSSHPGKMVNFGLLPPIIHDLLLLQQNYEEPRVRLKPLGPLLINLPPSMLMLKSTTKFFKRYKKSLRTFEKVVKNSQSRVTNSSKRLTFSRIRPPLLLAARPDLHVLASRPSPSSGAASGLADCPAHSLAAALEVALELPLIGPERKLCY